MLENGLAEDWGSGEIGDEGIVRGDSFLKRFVCSAFFCTITETFGNKGKSGVVGTVAADEVCILAQTGGGDDANGRGCISLAVIEFVELFARISPI